MSTANKMTMRDRLTKLALGVTRAGTALSKLEPTDVSFLLGVVLMHDGLHRTFSLGVANIVTGIVLVATPLMFLMKKA